jgi:glycine cleavage system H protein
MSYPVELRYTKSHEWIRLNGSSVVVGVSWFAQDSMGDVVHVELPEVGDELNKGEPACEIESVKAVSDVYSPVTGTVIAVNEALEDSPENVNSDPYGDGWLFKVDIGATIDMDSLMTAADYKAHCG